MYLRKLPTLHGNFWELRLKRSSWDGIIRTFRTEVVHIVRKFSSFTAVVIDIALKFPVTIDCDIAHKSRQLILKRTCISNARDTVVIFFFYVLPLEKLGRVCSERREVWSLQQYQQMYAGYHIEMCILLWNRLSEERVGAFMELFHGIFLKINFWNKSNVFNLVFATNKHI